jgi:Integrase core domain
MDNIFVERLWRSLKYEEVDLNAYASVAEAKAGIGSWLAFYNQERQHQSLGYRTPGLSHAWAIARLGYRTPGLSHAWAIARLGYRTPRQADEAECRWICGRSAWPTGCAFAHIPTGTTANHRIDIDQGEGRSNVMSVAKRDRSRY